MRKPDGTPADEAMKNNPRASLSLPTNNLPSTPSALALPPPVIAAMRRKSVLPNNHSGSARSATMDGDDLVDDEEEREGAEGSVITPVYEGGSDYMEEGQVDTPLPGKAQRTSPRKPKSVIPPRDRPVQTTLTGVRPSAIPVRDILAESSGDHRSNTLSREIVAPVTGGLGKGRITSQGTNRRMSSLL
jgi:hypothetical protein